MVKTLNMNFFKPYVLFFIFETHPNPLSAEHDIRGKLHRLMNADITFLSATNTYGNTTYKRDHHDNEQHSGDHY